ncbi:type IV pilus twitching motility protein PilT [Cellulomonas fengjieae]|uniref:type IV pilus twitching motility protein PilT n=1 Tax=Cellulomonas fengjieae TaxID=2819978 RepID=UPI001AAF8D6B|nr:type IV pilus twitching motility protein PilT [Cellulomonas fengjieae]MBO3102649.1 PilT/PilU family type 4a pilus ATPase [Cellulomonas fengjieae]
MSENYREPVAEPTRPLPPYRPAGPQPTAAASAFSPIPSQSVAPAAPPAPIHPYGAPAGSPGVGQAGPGFAAQAPAGPPSFTGPATFVPGGQAAPAAPSTGTRLFLPAPPPPPEPAPAPVAVVTPPTREQRPTPAGRDRGPRRGSAEDLQADDLPIDAILTEMVRLGASDVHLTTGTTPMVRVNGSLHALENFSQVTPDGLRRSIYAFLTQKQREKFEANLELDLSYAVRGLARFRVNIYQQRESIGAAFRVIPYEIKPLEELGVPAIVGTFAGLPRGLVLVTGPTGSGKSTTLASVVDLANRTRQDHIMTVEDPIEFLHRHKKCVVNQREVGQDTHSFANALKHVLRQDPDIILVGEMRDLETISVALTAAETGHLVFATLHTQDAAQTIDRVIDVFPAHQQAQIRTQLAGAIQGVVCQTLAKRSDAPGRAVATEVLVATPAIRNLIREGKTHQIYSAMQAGAKQGMHTMDQHLADLVKVGKISYETGLEKCHHVEDFNRLTGRFSGGSQGAAGMGDAVSMGGASYGSQAL